jgi:hypothetical protein
MKVLGSVMVVLVLLSGCGSGDAGLEGAMAFRDRLLDASGCEFSALITADYGTEADIFRLDVRADTDGNVAFEVTEPEPIAGITGTVTRSGGALTFDDTILGFPMLAEGRLAPVCAPWVVLKALRSGYISSVGQEGEQWRLTALDSYEEDALVVDVWFDRDWAPVHSEVLFRGENILTLSLEDLRFV